MRMIFYKVPRPSWFRTRMGVAAIQNTFYASRVNLHACNAYNMNTFLFRALIVF